MDRESVEKRPAILVVGSPNVGKRTLLSRLLKVDFEDASDSDASPELSVHGWTINTKYYTADVAGVERLYGALSAHMWPGMLLKSGDKINEPSLPEQEELSEEEEDSDYEPEYELLSSGSAAEPCDDVGWKSADGPVSTSGSREQMENDLDTSGRKNEMKTIRGENQPSTSASEIDSEEATKAHEADPMLDLDEDKPYDFEDLEMLMSEIGNMRSGLRLMPDFQRREMAAKLAMKMASMFGDSSGGEEELID